MSNSNQSNININFGNINSNNIISNNIIQSYTFTSTLNSTYYLSFVAPDSNLTSLTNYQLNNAVYNISVLNQTGQTIDSFSTSQLNTSPTLYFNLNVGTYSIQISQSINLDSDQYQFQIGNIDLKNNKNITNIQIPGGSGTIPNVNIKGSIQTNSNSLIYAINLNAGDLCSFTCTADTTSTLGGLSGEKISLLNSNGGLLENNNATLTLQQVGLAEEYINSDPSIQTIAPYTGTYYLVLDSPVSTGSFNLNVAANDMTELLKGVLRQMGSNPNDGYWGAVPNKTLNLTFCFMTSEIIPNTSSGYDPSKPINSVSDGFVPMTIDQQKAVVAALNVVSSLCNIQFTLSTDPTTANILYGTNTETSSSGSTYIDSKNNDGTFKQVSVFISNFFPSVINNLSQIGSFGFNTLLHETGHALGLKHPGAYDSASVPLKSDSYKYYDPIGWDNTQFSIMSYVYGQNSAPYDSSYASLDIKALQSIYGPPSNLSVVTFTVSPTVPIYTSATMGLKGSTIDLSNQTQGSSVSLMAGTYSSIGKNSDGSPLHDNIVIPWGSQYTNVVGSSNGGDVIYCNQLNNVIILNGPNDTVVGSNSAISQVSIPSSWSNFTQSLNQNTLTLTDKTQKFGVDTLSNVSRVNFNDNVSIAYDLNGNAGQVAKIIGAIFGLSYLSNQTYVGLGLKYMDSGVSFAQLSMLALTATNLTQPADIVKLLFKNIFYQETSSNVVQAYTQMISNGLSISDFLISEENSIANTTSINLSGLSNSGLMYSPQT